MYIHLRNIRQTLFSLNTSSKLATSTLFLLILSPSALTEIQYETSVISAHRAPKPVSELSSSISKISDSQLLELTHVHVGEALQRVPGITFHRGSGQESLMGLRSPVLTGAGACGAFQISQDGIPVRGAGFCNVNQLFDANTEQADSIEIVRGPGSILFGANAIHGAINTISFASDRATENRIQLDLGPHDYSRLKLASSATSGAHQFAIRANGASDGGYVEESGFDQQKLSLMHAYHGDISVKSVFSATNLNQETAGYLVGTDAYKDNDLRETNANPEAFRDATSYRFHSQTEFDSETTQWMIKPYYRNTDMIFLMHFLPGTPLEENGHWSIGIQSMGAREIGKVDLRFGVDLEYSSGYLRQYQENGFGPFPEGMQYDYEVDSSLISPFALLENELSASDSLQLGLRSEHLRYDYDNKMISGNTDENGVACVTGACRYSRPDDRKDNFENATLALGWVHQLSEQKHVFANATTAFRAPQSTELYRLQQDQEVSDLDSENIQSFELGFRSSTEKLRFEISGYYSYKRNLIFQDSERNNVSGADTAHRGIEFFSELNLTDDLKLSIAGSYAKHSYENDVMPRGVSESLNGNDVDSAPRLNVNTNLRWEFLQFHHLNLEALFVDEYYTDEKNEHRYPGHTLWHLRYSYLSDKNWDVSIRILNLLDKAYAERADYTGFTGDRYFAGEPRSVYGSVTYRF